MTAWDAVHVKNGHFAVAPDPELPMPGLLRPPVPLRPRGEVEAEYLRRAAVVGITWPVPPELDDTALERRLFTPPGVVAALPVRPQPDWVRIYAELRRPGVTLQLLWEEYRAGQPEGYGYRGHGGASPRFFRAAQ